MSTVRLPRRDRAQQRIAPSDSSHAWRRPPSRDRARAYAGRPRRKRSGAARGFRAVARARRSGQSPTKWLARRAADGRVPRDEGHHRRGRRRGGRRTAAQTASSHAPGGMGCQMRAGRGREMPSVGAYALHGNGRAVSGPAGFDSRPAGGKHLVEHLKRPAVGRSPWPIDVEYHGLRRHRTIGQRLWNVAERATWQGGPRGKERADRSLDRAG